MTRMRDWRTWLVALAAAAVVAACGGDAAPAPVPPAASPAATPMATATATPTATPAVTSMPTAAPAATPTLSDSLELITVTDASPTSLLLEWTGAPANALRWQYRQRETRSGAWGEWMDVPNSTGSTRSYRVTGLTQFYPYYFQVRPVTGAGPGAASPEKLGATPRRNDGVLELIPDLIVEGGGHTWLLSTTIELTIPAGVRVMECGGGLTDGGYVEISLCHPASGSTLTFNTETGELLRERIRSPEGAGAADSAEDVGALFDQILSTMTLRVIPDRSSPTPTATPTPPLSDTLKLITVSDGSPTALLLEWTGAPADALRWQYRKRETYFGTWEAWLDVPGSTGSTRSYRVSGLPTWELVYFQVRAVTAEGAGAPSPEAEGIPPHLRDGVPKFPPDQIAEGGRTWLLGGNIELTIPEGFRFVECGGAKTDTGRIVVNICHVGSRSGMSFDIESGESAAKVVAPEGKGASLTAADLEAAFDQIRNSMTLRGHTR